jgi:predicted PurR-regulated permease PerM
LAIAATLHDPIQRMRRAKLPRALAMTIGYGVTLLGLLGLLLVISMPLSAELEQLLQESVDRYSQLQEERPTPAAPESATSWQETLWANLPPIEELDALISDNSTATLLWGLFGITQGIVNVIAQLLVAIALSIYWTADQLHFERLWLSLLPPQQRIRARHLWRTLEGNIGAYLRSEVLQSLLVGALLTAGFYAMGLSYPFLLATLAAISWFIPLIGGALGLILVMLIAFFDGLWWAGGAGIFTLIIFLIMEYYLEPKLYRRDHYSAILVLLMMLALLYALGLLGLLIAPPLALCLQVLLNELILPSTLARQRVEADQQQEESLAKLRQRIRALQATLTAEDEPSPRLQNLAKRLDTLVTEISQARVERYLERRNYR